MTTVKYQNFDFGRRWSEVVPHLLTPEFKSLYRKIKRESYVCQVNGYVKKDIPPAEISSFDCFCMLLDRTVEYDREHPERMTESEKKLFEAYDNVPDCDSDRGQDKLFRLYNKVSDSILTRYGLRWSKTSRHHLAFYIPFGQAYLWNRVFGLWLAQKVCPEGEWVVREGKKHCTVICKKTKRIFDIIYWGIDDRLEDYCHFLTGQDYHHEELVYRNSDITLGGKQAYKRSKKSSKFRFSRK
jgi:hypothetical protein